MKLSEVSAAGVLDCLESGDPGPGAPDRLTGLYCKIHGEFFLLDGPIYQDLDDPGRMFTYCPYGDCWGNEKIYLPMED